MLYLLQRIVLWNFAEFIEATGRTPTATIDSVFQRRIKAARSTPVWPPEMIFTMDVTRSSVAAASDRRKIFPY